MNEQVSEAMADCRAQNLELERKIDAVTARYKQRKAEYVTLHTHSSPLCCDLMCICISWFCFAYCRLTVPVVKVSLTTMMVSVVCMVHAHVNVCMNVRMGCVCVCVAGRLPRYDSAHRDKMSSIDQMQEDIVQMHDTLAAQTAEWVRQREAAELEEASVLHEIRTENDQLTKIVMEMADVVVNHKQRIQECTHAYRDAILEVKGL